MCGVFNLEKKKLFFPLIFKLNPDRVFHFSVKYGRNFYCFVLQIYIYNQEMLAFQNDRALEARKFVVSFIEEAR